MPHRDSTAAAPLVARAYLELLVVRLRLRLGGFARLARGPAATAAQPGATAERKVAALVSALATAERIPPGHPSCLAHALTLRRLLHAAGVPGELRIGVTTPGPAFGAHAWVEVNGRPVGESATVDLGRFAVLESAGKR